MTHNDDTHDHDHNHEQPTTGPDDPRARARALQSLLVEKDLLSTDAVDAAITAYEQDVGPLNGAKVVARAWTDSAFKDQLLTDANTALKTFDFEAGLQHIEVVENTPTLHNVVVCTLCSCYPWSLLGLPPTWYKTPAYRSRMVREPRAVLAEFGVDLSEHIEVKVWDSSSEIRYMVLPQRPPVADELSESELADYVSRDSMIGVERIDTTTSDPGTASEGVQADD